MPIAPPPQLKAGLFARNVGAGKKDDKKKDAPKAAGPKGFPIEHRIGVQAPAEVIWNIVSDLERWSEWNPLYPKAAGAIRIGSQLTLTLALPGQAQRQIQPVVLEWVPNEQLHWRLTMLGGLVNNVRYIEIEQLAEESCIVSNGEIFGGLMGPTVAKSLGRAVHRGFREMNEALKARAEAHWSAAKG
ncbi:SRPBCC domain-containing protein [Phenylobacterium soli]|uniref:SRPBCC domain-containing protein n=1 Tax=Phenylobacterium soli TaxID=2170551 RepID=UPI0014036EC6|nr:SRPBCC domain-containing protein [Phenylobacterium soli]